MSKKHKKKNIKTSIEVPNNRSNINILYFILMLIFNIVLISNITGNKFYSAHHTPLQLLAYLVVYNLTFLIFYNYHYKIFSKKTLKYLYIGLGVSILYVYVISFYPVLELNGDNAGYLARAQSVLQGKGFRSIWLPKEPYEATLKGIGFSLLNIPFILLFGINNYVGLKLLEFFSVFAGLFFMYKYFENKMSKDTLFLLTVMVAMYSQIIHFSSIIMTESVAFFLLFLNLYLIDKYILPENKIGKKFILKIVGISFLLFLTFTVREAMISLVGAVPLYLLIKRRWKELFIMSFFIMIFFSIYFLYSQHLKYLNQIYGLVKIKSASFEGKSFIEHYLSIILKKGVTLKSFWFAFLVISQKIVGNPDISKYDDILINLIVLLILLTGIFIYIKEKRKPFIYGIFSSLLIVIVVIFWGVQVDVVVFSRYFYPLIPIIFFYFIIGIEGILKLFKFEKYNLYILIILLSLVLNNNLNRNLQKVYTAKYPYSPAVQHFIDACKWINHNTSNNTIIANRKSTLAYIWAQRKSMHYFDVDNYTRYDKYSQKFETDTLQYYTNNHIQYIILDAFSYDAYYKILPIIKNNMNRFKVLYKTSKPETYVLKVIEL